MYHKRKGKTDIFVFWSELSRLFKPSILSLLLPNSKLQNPRGSPLSNIQEPGLCNIYFS